LRETQGSPGPANWVWIDNGQVVLPDLTHRLCKAERIEPATTFRSSLARSELQAHTTPRGEVAPARGLPIGPLFPGPLERRSGGFLPVSTRFRVARCISIGTLGRLSRSPVVTAPRLDTLHGRRPSRVTGITGESFLTVTAPVSAGRGVSSKGRASSCERDWFKGENGCSDFTRRRCFHRSVTGCRRF
jgi:hypothetical protein